MIAFIIVLLPDISLHYLKFFILTPNTSFAGGGAQVVFTPGNIWSIALDHTQARSEYHRRAFGGRCACLFVCFGAQELRHKHVVALHEVYAKPSGNIFLVFDFLDVDLEQIISAKNPDR